MPLLPQVQGKEQILPHRIVPGAWPHLFVEGEDGLAPHSHIAATHVMEKLAGCQRPTGGGGIEILAVSSPPGWPGSLQLHLHRAAHSLVGWILKAPQELGQPILRHQYIIIHEGHQAAATGFNSAVEGL